VPGFKSSSSCAIQAAESPLRCAHVSSRIDVTGNVVADALAKCGRQLIQFGRPMDVNKLVRNDEQRGLAVQDVSIESNFTPTRFRAVVSSHMPNDVDVDGPRPGTSSDSTTIGIARSAIAAT
jgi:hypothetical protein